ncbi:DNase I-like protein [Testicularia cyperi]|uniref:DNase I-like protein n=1 Tax=Testicularia cyperi TaxID=1882483 RepID=A0A317XM89_9BASI|nr:DNase I-like protein [Testicularia cyperi]
MSSQTGLRVQIATYNANLQGADATRHDLTPWLIPTAEQAPVKPVSSAPLSNEKVLHADAYKSRNARALSTHPSLPREAPDFYAVGFQELIPLHIGFAATGDSALYNTDLDIRKTIRPHQAVVSGNGMYASQEEGGGPEGYPLLCRVDLVGIALFVYARERTPFSINKATKSNTSAASRVKEIRTAKVGTGLGGVMGNKGGVGARIVVGAADGKGPDEVLTFVSSHLAAHDHNVLRRNRDWQQIVERMVFAPSCVSRLPLIQTPVAKLDPKNMDALKEKHAQSTQQSDKAKKAAPLDNNSYTIYDTTHLFVFGDLNHRIALGKSELERAASGSKKGPTSEPLSEERLHKALEVGDWSALAGYDQLNYQRLASPPKAFHGLTELPIDEAGIPPTYKYVVTRTGKKTKQKPGGITSDALDGQTLSKKRVPGWTDRILWASAPGKDDNDRHGAEVEFYRSIMQYTHSDHKPVTTLLRLPAPASGKAEVATLSQLNPYPALPAWNRQALAISGLLLDRLVGYTWSLLLLAGGGSLAGGIIEVLVIGIITAWWFSQSRTAA